MEFYHGIDRPEKANIKIVVDGYVATAEPVSSKAIAEKMPGRISSATIRNELADWWRWAIWSSPTPPPAGFPPPRATGSTSTSLWSAVRCRRRRPRASASPSPGKCLRWIR